MENNEDKLFEVINNISESIALLRVGFSTLTTKIDDFSYRLRKLEERDDKRLEREERVTILLAKTETSLKNSERDLSATQERVDEIEKDIRELKNNWKWLAGLTTALGGTAGFIASEVVKRMF